MSRPSRQPRMRPFGLPVLLSLAVHGIALVVLAVLLARPVATAGDGETTAPLHVALAFETPADPVTSPEPPAPEPSPVDEPLREPVDHLPDALPNLPPEPMEVEEDYLPEPDAPSPEAVPTLPVQEIPLRAVKPRRPRVVPHAQPALPPPTVRSPRPPARPAVRPQAPRALRVVSQPDPSRWYPEEARRRGVEGTALVRITIDVRGVVTDARVKRTSGSLLLDRQAVRVGFAYRFAPGTPGRADLPVRFRLD